MSNDNTLIVKNSGILFLRLIITTGIGFFSTRFVIQGLGASDFGLYNVVGGVVIMMAFLNTVMSATTYRFIAFEIGKKDLEEVNKVFNISLVIHLALALIVVFLTETAGVFYVKNYLNIDPSKLSDALFVLRFSTYAMVFSIVSIPYQGMVTAHENFSVQAYIEFSRTILVFFVAVTLVYFTGNKLKLYALLTAIVSIIPALTFYLYCNRSYKTKIKWKFHRDKRKYKEMIGFSGWVIFGAAASIGNSTGTSLIINAFFGTILNAAYGIANQVNSIAMQFSRTLGQAAIPQITKSYSSGDTDRTYNLAAYISKYTWFLMALPALPILIETHYLLNLWLGDIPEYSVLFCQLIIINALIGNLTNSLSTVIQATGKIKIFTIILSVISLMSLPIAYLLFKLGYPPYTILFVNIGTTVIGSILWQVLLKMIIDFDIWFFIKTSYLKVFYVAMLTSPLFFIHSMFQESFLRFILFSGFAMVWLLTVIYFAGLERKEKEKLKILVQKLIYSSILSKK